MFSPTSVPNDATAGLKSWLADQFRSLAAYLRDPTPNTVTLSVLGQAPSKPVNGMIVYADGTAWNPGSGAGYYGYRANAWRKLDT